MNPEPLTDEEFEKLDTALARLADQGAMNLEEIDGFFAALICSPDTVPPSEYLPEIFGGDVDNLTRSEVEEFLSLLMRHWSATCHALQSGDAFLPLLLEDEHGVTPANDWAIGFMRGMELRSEDWASLLDDDEHGGWLVPILTLAHEHDPDPEMRPYNEPVSAERREKLIVGVAAGVMAIYDYFESERLERARRETNTTTVRRIAPKVGRNDACPCGSGKKFKHCCGKPTLH